MKINRVGAVCLIFCGVFISGITFPQSGKTGFNPEKDRTLRFMFYNVENLFDTIENPDANDEEFLPGGTRNWNGFRYYQKKNRIYKTIMAAGGWRPPELIGLCEIENETVLEDILWNTPFSKFEYKYIHKNSPDHRGIDVALLYDPERFFPVSEKYIRLKLPDEYSSTREILYAKGHTKQNDTIHVFVNHWPSKYGGAAKSQPKRNIAAKTLKAVTDSILKSEKQAKLIITGDFNDGPTAESIQGYLKVKAPADSVINQNLYNLSEHWLNEVYGTYKYQGQWSVIDQLIVSGSLLKNSKELKTTEEDAHIFAPSFLLEKDEKYIGKKPYRTYVGFKYNGGFSDHLP
ncbi:MAG: endonuclease, partial [Bacteroidota bacterium]